MKESVTLDEIIEYLNELIGLDASAMTALSSTRVPCNDAMAKHPTVQASSSVHDGCRVGLIGVINGMLGVHPDNYGAITWVIKDSSSDPELIRVRRTLE